MAPMSQKLVKHIPSRADRLHEVREFVSRSAREFGFDDEDTANIVLAVDEACTNVIKHAYNFAPDKEIAIEIIPAQGEFEVRVLDYGKPFNPGDVKPPNLRQHLKEYRRGGLGVYLMKTLMDKVEYNFKQGERNEVRLTKYLQRKRTNAAS
jgi:serine/threonine-protein kinase RsbW